MKVKTMTRRLDGLKEINKEPDNWIIDKDLLYNPYQFVFINLKTRVHKAVKPRYQIGEVVYIKEAWRTGRGLDDLPPHCSGDKSPFQYKLDMASIRGDDVTKWSPWGKWRSPLFLPAWAARDFIKITKVGIGRLQDITEEEAKAEGAECVIWHGEHAMAYENNNRDPVATYKAGFANLWDSINGKTYPWKLNPWNWEISYELLESK